MIAVFKVVFGFLFVCLIGGLFFYTTSIGDEHMRKVVRKDAPKQRNGKSTEHWSDRHKVLISIVAWTIFIGSFVFLMWAGDSIK